MPHEPVNDDPALQAAELNEPAYSNLVAEPAAWTSFCAAIGATMISEERFHPFFHEIVAVEPAEDPEELPAVTSEHWPGALVNAMVLARSGVTVRGGASHMNPEVAARSCLYWAWWRRNRVTQDLSVGWGHNSQWRTNFRRDFFLGDRLCYNVDRAGSSDFPSEDELSEAEGFELLRHRHCLLRDVGNDCWPYDTTYTETRARSPFLF